MVELIEEDPLLGTWILDQIRVAAYGEQIDMNADKLLRTRSHLR